MAYLGNTPTQQGFTPAIDYFSGNASTTAFTLSRPVASVAQVQAVIENVPQNPGDAFTVSGNTITFTSAPPSGTNNIYVYYTSPITTVVQPGQGTVGTAQLVSGLTLTDPVYTGTLTGGTGVINIGSGQFYKDSSGNVGIGTSSPSSKLHVYSSGQIGTIESSGNYATTGSGYLRWKDVNGNAAFVGYGGNANTFDIYNSLAGALTFSTSATERMRIDSSGRVTMPYQPAFNAYISSGTTIANSWVEAVYNNVCYNNGNHYNASTGRFTAPVSGYYLFCYALTFTAEDSDGTIGIFINGNYDGTTSVSQLSQGATGATYSGRGGSGVMYLAAGDYASVWNYNTSSRVTRSGNPRGGFISGILLG